MKETIPNSKEKDPFAKFKTMVSKLNDPSQWQIEEGPHLRIIDQTLWEEGKAKQASQKQALRKQPITDRNRLSSCQTLRRREYLLSALMTCGNCGGGVALLFRPVCSLAKMDQGFVSAAIFIRSVLLAYASPGVNIPSVVCGRSKL